MSHRREPIEREPTRRVEPGFGGCRWVGALTLIAALASPALGQDPVDQGFGDTSRVVAVEVPVHVTDREGQPVRGLTRDDFVVLDDGDRQSLSNFEIIDLEALAVRSFEARRARERLPAAGRRHVLLLFDLSFSRPGSLLRARTAARRWVLESLHPTDLAAVVVDSLKTGPRLILTFTPDRAQLARAIDTLGDPRLLAVERPDPLRFVIDTPDAASDGLSLLEGLTTGEGGLVEATVLENLRLVGLEIEKSQRAYQRSRIVTWAKALDDLASSLATIKGRKQVLYFSEGFDGTLLFGETQAPQDPDVQRQSLDREQGRLWAVDSDTMYGNSQLQGRIDRMLESFRRADCVIQAVDIAGLSTSDGAGRRQENVGRDALFYLARSTGGELHQNANDLGHQLDAALERTTVTYLLTFERSDLEPDGSYHRLDVRLASKRRGTQVSHRTGYNAPRRFDTLHPLERDLLAASAIASATPRDELELRLLAPPFRNGAGAYVPLILEIPGQRLLEGVEGDELELELYAYATDSRGTMRDYFTQQLRVDLRSHRSTLVAGGLKVYGHLDLGAGDHLVRLLVRDSTLGRTGVVTQEVEVPAWGAGAPMTLPPLAIESPGKWMLVRQDEATGGSGVVYPFVVDGTPFVPAVMPQMTPEESWRIVLVAYHFGEGTPGFSGEVLDAEGAVVSGGRFGDLERTVSPRDDVEKLVVPFTPRKLDPGAYTLRLTLTEPETGQGLLQTLPILVETGP